MPQAGQLTRRIRYKLHRPVCRRRLLESQVRSVLMVVSEEFLPEAAQVLFIERG
jgi:hypothetical protein